MRDADWQTEDGSIRLYCVDCRDYLDDLRGEVDCVVTDPPYGMAYQSGWRAVQHGMIHGDDSAAMLSWSCDWSRRTVTHSAYLFCRWDNLADVSKPDGFVTWVKNNHSSGDLDHAHARMTEGVVFYRGPSHYFPNGRPRDVVQFARVESHRHPTEKPVDLLEEICRWTAGTVADPFMGVGSCGVACVRLGRRFIGIERERKYFDIAVDRITKELNRMRLFEPPPKIISRTLPGMEELT